MNRVYEMTFSSVYPLYLKKVERKGRQERELKQVIEWLTGFNEEAIKRQIEADATFKEFFAAAKLNPNVNLIKGVICGIRVEDIKDPLMQQIRYLDKLVDELARGKTLAKILRG